MFIKLEKFLIFFNDKLQSGFFVEIWVDLEILNDIIDGIIPLRYSGRLELNVTEVNMKVIESRLVMDESANFVLGNTEFLLDSFQAFVSDIL